MKNWYENSLKALKLNGKGERTQQSYTRAVELSWSKTWKISVSGLERKSRRWDRTDYFPGSSPIAKKIRTPVDGVIR